MNKLVVPYDPKTGNPNQIFSEEFKAGQPEQNRALEISLKDDIDKDFSIGLKDINEAVNYYFTEILKLSVVQNNTKVDVPIIYGNAENWKSVQADGYYRDRNGKLMAPLLMFKRTNLTQNRGLGNKLDGNTVKNVQVFEKSFNRRNVYSNFNVVNSRAPEKEYVVAVTPDYVTVEYSCIVWTHFMEQMDKIIEALNFASRSYWGDPNRFQFYSSIESFQDNLTLEVGEDRLVKNSFTLTLNGYLIPDVMNKSLASVNRVFSAANIVFGLETATSSEQFVANQNQQPGKKLSNIVASDSRNIINNITNVPSDVILYINTNKELTGTFVNPTTVVFGPWLSAPSGLPATSVDSFTFFCNGQFIEKTAIVSFTQSNGVSTLVIDPTLLQYSFEQSDIITGIGKFL
mgnify:CR=1 FL=1